MTLAEYKKNRSGGASASPVSKYSEYRKKFLTNTYVPPEVDAARTEASDMFSSRNRGLGLQELNTQVQTGASKRTVPFPAASKPNNTLAVPKPIISQKQQDVQDMGSHIPALRTHVEQKAAQAKVKAYQPITPEDIKLRVKKLTDDLNVDTQNLDASYRALTNKLKPVAPEKSWDLKPGSAKPVTPDGFLGENPDFKVLANIQKMKMQLQMQAKEKTGEAEAKRQLLAEQAQSRILLDPKNQDSWNQHVANSMSWQESNKFQLDPHYQMMVKAETYTRLKQEDAQRIQDELNNDQFTAKKVAQTILTAAGETFTAGNKAAVQYMAGMGANTQELLTTITGVDFLGNGPTRKQYWDNASAIYDQLATDRAKMVGTDKRLGFIWDAAGAIPDAVMLMGLAYVSGGSAAALPLIGKFMPAAKGIVTGGRILASPLIREGLIPIMKRTLTFAPEMIPMFVKITSQSYGANIKSGMSEPRAFLASIIDAYGQSLLEGGGMNEAFKNGGVKGAIQWAKTWASEGSEEITQNWWENAINALVSGKTVPVISFDANEQSIINVPQDLRAGAIGSVVAAGMGGAGAVYTGAVQGAVGAGQGVAMGVNAVKAKFNPTVVSQPDLFAEAQKSAKYANDMVKHIQSTEQYATAKTAYNTEVARVGVENTAAQQVYDAEAAKVNAQNNIITKGAAAGQAEVDAQNKAATKGYEAIVRKGLDITNTVSVSRGVNANLTALTAQVRKEQEARSANAYVAVDTAENSFDERNKTPEQIHAWKQTLAPVYNELLSAEAALEKPINRADIRNILLKGRASTDLIQIASKGLIPAPAIIKGQSTAQPIPMPVAPALQPNPVSPVRPGTTPVAPAPGEAVIDTSKMIPAIAAKLEATYAGVTPAQRTQVLALAKVGTDRSATVEQTSLSPAQVRSVLSMNGIPDIKTRAGKMWVRQQAYLDSVKTQASTAVEDRTILGREAQVPVEEQQAKLDRTSRKGLVVATDLTVGHKYVQSLAKTLGRDVVYYNGGKEAANAFYSTGAEQTLFINIDAATDAQATTVYMGHEFLHSIQQTDSKMYTELRKAFGSTLTSEQAAKALAKFEAFPEDHAKLAGDVDALMDEMMAEEAGTLFISKSFWDSVAAQNENVAQKLARLVRNFLNRVLDTITASPNADVVGKLQLQEFQKKFEAAVGGIIKNADAQAKAALDEAGMASTADTVAPPVEQFANRTFTRDMESNDLYNALLSKGIEPVAAKRWLKDMTSVARTIRANAEVLDYAGSNLYAALKSNKDPQYKTSLDFSTLCVKRYILQATLEAAQVRLGRGLSVYEWLEIRKQLKTAGQVVSCGLCYVEAVRMRMGDTINNFYDNYVTNKTWYARTKREGEIDKATLQRDTSTIVPYTENIPSKDLFLTQEGLDDLKANYNEVYTDFNNLLSSTVKMKLQESRVEYDRDIFKHYKKPETVASQNRNSGQRLQSWSDFEAVHLLDLMQATVDMNLVGLKAHAYTKVLDFVRSMAKTGIMINMSLVPKGNGFNADGTLAWDNVEGIDYDKAKQYAVKYPNTVGFAAVGVSPAHIRALLKDPNIHYIIPYHISGNSKLKRTFSGENTKDWTDFTSYQNESFIKGGENGDKFAFYDWWIDGNSAESNVARYKELCARNNLRPRFSGYYVQAGTYNADFDFSQDPNYYKMLGDRRLFDNKGKPVVQQVVKPVFDDEVNQDILADYIANPTPNAAHEPVVTKFLSDLESGVDFTPTEEDIRDLEATWKAVKKAEEQQSTLAYHGSPHDFGGFTTQKIGSGEGAQAYGWGMYFASNKTVATWYRDKLSRGATLTYDDPSVDKVALAKAVSIAQAYQTGAPPKEAISKFLAGFNSLRQSHLAVLKKIETQRVQGFEVALDLRTENRAWELDTEAYKLLSTIDLTKLKANTGKLYTVELAPDEEDYLDWDKPLDEQADKVKGLLQEAGLIKNEEVPDRRFFENWLKKEYPSFYRDWGILTSGQQANVIEDFVRSTKLPAPDLTGMLGDKDSGARIYQVLSAEKGREQAASEYLASIGIPGIRFLDGSSRSRGEGNSNYVIFEDKNVSITEKFSVRLAKDLGVTQQEADIGGAALADLVIKSKTPRAKTIAKDWTEKFLTEGMVSFRDVQVNGADDIAIMAQVYRDPRFETARMIFIGYNPRVGYRTILHQTGVTSRVPGASRVMPGATTQDEMDWLNTQFQLAAGVGATEFYMLHNHPSGDPTPSTQDRDVNVKMARAGDLQGVTYRGHIIVNSGKYAFMGPGHLGTDRFVTSPITEEDKLLTPEKTHPELGYQVTSSASAKNLAVSLKAPAGYSTLVFMSPNNKVRGIQEIPTSYAEDRVKLRNYLKKNALGFGGHGVTLIAETEKAYRVGAGAISGNFIFDSISPTGEAARDVGYIQGPRDTWMGEPLTAFELQPPKEQFSVRAAMTPEAEQKIVNNAIKSFGLTTDFKEAGYLLKNGMLLDFSEKQNGGQRGSRSADHRQINEAFPNGLDLGHSEYMTTFMDMGNIRINGDDGFEVTTIPTPQQERMLGSLIRQNAKYELLVDLVKDNNHNTNPETLEHPAGVLPSRVFADIHRFYETGEVQKSITADFHTQNSIRPHIFNYGTQKPPVDHGAAWSKTYSEVVDTTFRITQASKEAGRLALNTKLVSGSVDYILKHEMVGLDGRTIGVSLKSVTDKMTPDDWDYLAYRHNIDRYMEGKPVIPGADVAASRQYVAAAEARDPSVKTRADAVVKWIDTFMQEWGVNSGLIDATTYGDWRVQYPSYFPTYREFSDLEAGNTGTGAPGRHFIDLPSTVKRATGSDRELTHPVGNIMQMVNKVVRSARYNEVGVALMNAVRANPAELAKYAEEIPPRLGMFSRANNIVSVWDGGTPKYMQVNDQALLDTLNGLPKVINNAKVARKVTRLFKSLITTDNPFFAIRNMFRDIPTAYVYGSQWNPITFSLNLLRADFSLIFNTEMARQYKGLGGAGGGQFNTGVLDIPRKGGTNAYDAGQLAKTMAMHPLKYVNPMHYIRMFNEIIEQAPRLAEFDYVLRKSGDVQKALRAAQEVTVDFSRGGNIAKSLDAYIPFFNASVQGIDTFGRKMLDASHPAQMASRWIKAAVMVTTPAIVSILMCTGNDRDRKAYETVSQFIKDSSYLFPKGDGTFWRIPKSRELGVLFASLFERLFTKTIVPGLEVKGMDFSFLSTVFSNFLPVNPLAGSIVSPALINLPMNKTFANATIVPSSLTKYSAGLQYDDNTSVLAKAIGKATYDLTGGGISPKQIDYIMDSYLGIIADFALPAMTPRSGAGNALNRMSIGAYSTDPAFSSQRTEDFYNRVDKLENLANDPNRLQNIPAAVKTPEERTYTAFNALLPIASSATKYINTLKQDDPQIQKIRNTNNEWMAKAVKATEAAELVQIKAQWHAALYQLGVRE